MASTTSTSSLERELNAETMITDSQTTNAAEFFRPPSSAQSPPRVPAWNAAPHTSASARSNMDSPTNHPPGSPIGGRNHHPHNGTFPHHHHSQRPLATYTTLGSPRTTTRVRSASFNNAPYQQKVTPNVFPGNPQASGVTFLPFLGNVNPQPPEISTERKAMEAAAAAERTRAKGLEESERNMTADELRDVLKKERHRMAKIQADLAALRSGSVQHQFQAEVLEEGRINGLMRRMDDLQEEKGRIIVELEREEEMVSITDIVCKVVVFLRQLECIVVHVGELALVYWNVSLN